MSKLIIPFRGQGKVHATSEVALHDGFGNALPIAISQAGMTIDAATITAATLTSAALPTITGNVTFADGTTDVDIASHDGTNGLKLGGTLVSASPVEINKADQSVETETIDSGVAVSVTKRITNIDNTVTGAGAITLAAPDATMIGLVKVIEMTVDGGDVTLALTNVQGGSAATTATFSAVGQQLVLVGGSAKWTVIGQGGVVLT